MGNLTFILGGARSGKSRFAEEIARKYNENVAYIATCPYYDEEMKDRIKKHQERRPAAWGSFEEFSDLEHTIKQITNNKQYKIALIDCLTLYISNLLLNENLEESQIQNRIENALKTIKQSNIDAAIVSNEVGLGIVPKYKLGRMFRDIAGRMNQLVAQYADDVYFTVAGIPTKIK